MSRRILWAIVVALGIVCTGPARADDAQPPVAASAQSRSQSVAKLNDEGATLYKARDFRRAAEKFIQAYAIDPDPNLLFNIARSYDGLGDSNAAIEKYEAFLAKPGADSLGKQRAEDALRILRAKSAAAAAPPVASAPASKESAQKEGPAEPESGKRGRGALPWIALGTGLVATAIGTTAYMLGVKDHAKVRDADGYQQPGRVVAMTEAEATALIASGDRDKTIGVITLGVGGALLATSLILFTTGAPAAAADKAVALGLFPTTGGGAMSLRGKF